MHSELPYYKNIPIASSRNIPLALSAQRDGGFDGSYRRRRRYTRTERIEKLAVEKYKNNGRGLTFNDLLSSELASNKKQSQITLKHYRNKGILFTISAHKPQQYYPVCIKSEILKANLTKNIPVGVTEVGFSDEPHFSVNTNNDTTTINQCNEYIVANQSLEGYVLPLLPSAPLFIHKMHFKLKINPECYRELDIPIGKGNGGKEHVEVIGKVRANYIFYANGTVMVFTESSNTPFRLEDEDDRSRLIAFFGQLRDRLVTLLMDRHERIVPDIMHWQMTECDINKDVKVSDWLQVTSTKIQVKHLDHLFRVYIKSMRKDTVCRVEESLSCPKGSSAIEAINNIFNPQEGIENLIADSGSKFDKIISSSSTNDSKDSAPSNNILQNWRSVI